jgi:tetratricopeptide (TPR) repeat protein
MPRRASTHVDDPRRVGERLRGAREAAALRQRDLVVEGCSAAYISRIEAGERIPSYQLLIKFGELLGCSADYLATGEQSLSDDERLLAAELAAQSGGYEDGRSAYLALIEDGGPKLQARSALRLGRLETDRGEHAAAASQFEAALASNALPADEHQRCREQLGRAYALLGRFEEALYELEGALKEARGLDDQPAIMRASVLLANTHIDRGSYPRAEEVLAEVIGLARQGNDPVALSNLFWSQARLHSSQQHTDLAAHYARMAHATLAATEHTTFAARALLLLSQLENDRQAPQAALDLLDEADPILAAAGNRYDFGVARLERARSLGRIGEREEAASIALGAIANFEDSQPINAARGYGIAAEIFADLGDEAKAIELYELAAEALPTTDRHLAEIYRKLSAIYEDSGDSDQAIRYLKLAFDAQHAVVS